VAGRPRKAWFSERERGGMLLHGKEKSSTTRNSTPEGIEDAIRYIVLIQDREQPWDSCFGSF